MKFHILILTLLLMAGSHLMGQTPQYMGVDDYLEILEKENDTLYVYNFWATWCRPCVAELPHFEELNQHFPDKKVKVILVSLDFPDGFEKQLEPFLEKKQLTSEVWVLEDAYDNADWIDKIYEGWSGSIPATLINMPSKDIYAFEEKPFTWEELESWVETFIE